jgi:hypothetical protein
MHNHVENGINNQGFQRHVISPHRAWWCLRSGDDVAGGPSSSIRLAITPIPTETMHIAVCLGKLQRRGRAL